LSLKTLTKPHPFAKCFKSFSNENNKSVQTPDAFFAFSKPHHFKNAQEICASRELLKELGLSKLSESDLSFLSGGSQSAFVTRYGGHQFGHWAGQLGDGRAHLLGQFKGKWDVQVKGSGPNPYSRSGDGFAVLRSSLREFLMSEYMHHLGIPTTRALNLMTSGETVLRDMFYDGNAAYEPGALVTRIAPTFLRFGHFQVFSKNNEVQNLKSLVSWTLKNHFPKHSGDTDQELFEWFDHICSSTLETVIHWMRVGFVHGVLNTDNMSILGLTIDYGPFSMMDAYQREFTPNTTDLPGRRYSYENQPAVCLWNLERLAEALSPLVSNTNGFVESLNSYKVNFQKRFEKMHQKKLGLNTDLADSRFIFRTEQLLQNLELDYTKFFLALSAFHTNEELFKLSYKKLSQSEKQNLIDYFSDYRALFEQQAAEQKVSARSIQEKTNPKFNLRNYLFVEILDELKEGSKAKLEAVVSALKKPYSYNDNTPELYQKRPDWAAEKAGCTLLSCSS